jgi:hypothetical protein
VKGLCANKMLSRWMRKLFLLTSLINMIGTLFFVPPFRFGRALLGLSSDVHPLYLWIIASWIFLFGVAYFYLATAGKSERLLVYIGAFGKLCFGLLLIAAWLNSEASIWAVLTALTDITLAAIFLFWLYQTRHRW